MRLSNFGLMILLCTSLLSCSGIGSKQKPEEVQKKAVEPPRSIVETQALPEQEQLTPSKLPDKPETSIASPAVLALLEDADQNKSEGNLEGAAASIERALNIEPRNAELMYRLARIRLQQRQPEMAESLAKKSELLATDKDLKARAWLLIAEARQIQGKAKAAAEARNKANSFLQ